MMFLAVLLCNSVLVDKEGVLTTTYKFSKDSNKTDSTTVVYDVPAQSIKLSPAKLSK